MAGHACAHCAVAPSAGQLTYPKSGDTTSLLRFLRTHPREELPWATGGSGRCYARASAYPRFLSSSGTLQPPSGFRLVGLVPITLFLHMCYMICCIVHPVVIFKNSVVLHICSFSGFVVGPVVCYVPVCCIQNTGQWLRPQPANYRTPPP